MSPRGRVPPPGERAEGFCRRDGGSEEESFSIPFKELFGGIASIGSAAPCPGGGSDSGAPQGSLWDLCHFPAAPPRTASPHPRGPS